MAFGSGTVSAAGGAVGDILGGYAKADELGLKAKGHRVEAENYDLAMGLASENLEFTKQSTAIKLMQQDRELMRGQGATQASVAGAGFSASGSALDIMRENASQGALTHAVLGQQGLITEEGYLEQAKAYGNMANFARYAADQEDKMADDAITNGWITGGFKAASAVTSLFTPAGQ